MPAGRKFETRWNCYGPIILGGIEEEAIATGPCLYIVCLATACVRAGKNFWPSYRRGALDNVRKVAGGRGAARRDIPLLGALCQWFIDAEYIRFYIRLEATVGESEFRCATWRPYVAWRCATRGAVKATKELGWRSGQG